MSDAGRDAPGAEDAPDEKPSQGPSLVLLYSLIVLALVAAIGFANGPLTVAMFSLRQRATDPQWFGRAFAVSMNLNFVGSPIGASIAGALLTRSIPLTLLIAASCAVVGGFWPAVLPASNYEPVAQMATST